MELTAEPGHLVYEKVAGTTLTNVMINKYRSQDLPTDRYKLSVDDYAKTEKAWNEFVKAHDAPPNDANKARWNLYGALMVVRQLAKSLKQLQKRRIIHNDIKPDNIMIAGAAGVKMLDLGVACVQEADTYNEGAIPGNAGSQQNAPSFKSVCERIMCDPRELKGTASYWSARAVRKEFCLPSITKTKMPCADEMRTNDFFAVGVVLMQLFSGSNSNFKPTYVPKCVSSSSGRTRHVNPILSFYISLEGASITKENEDEANEISRRRLLTIIARLYSQCFAHAEDACLFCNEKAPISYFFRSSEENQKLHNTAKLRIPDCYTDKATAGFAEGDAAFKENRLINFNQCHITVLEPHDGEDGDGNAIIVDTGSMPKKWESQSKDEKAAGSKNLLDVPLSQALRGILDLLRKLLAWDPALAFTDGAEVITQIDAILKLLRSDAASESFSVAGPPSSIVSSRKNSGNLIIDNPQRLSSVASRPRSSILSRRNSENLILLKKETKEPTPFTATAENKQTDGSVGDLAAANLVKELNLDLKNPGNQEVRVIAVGASIQKSDHKPWISRKWKPTTRRIVISELSTEKILRFQYFYVKNAPKGKKQLPKKSKPVGGTFRLIRNGNPFGSHKKVRGKKKRQGKPKLLEQGASCKVFLQANNDNDFIDKQARV